MTRGNKLGRIAIIFEDRQNMTTNDEQGKYDDWKINEGVDSKEVTQEQHSKILETQIHHHLHVPSDSSRKEKEKEVVRLVNKLSRR